MKIYKRDLVVLTEKEDESLARVYDLASKVTAETSNPELAVSWNNLLDAIAVLSPFTVENKTEPKGYATPSKWSKELGEAICALPKELFEELLHSIEELNMKAYSNGFRDGCKEK